MCGVFSKIFAALLFLLLTTQSAYAQTEDWTIQKYNSDITIQEDGTVNVTETIETNFNVEKHGIFRDIPFVYATQDGGEYFTDLTVTSVTRDGKEEKYEDSRQGSYRNLKIGDAGKTISGNHTYVIKYTANGVLSEYDNYDELFWNTTGNYWDAPINKVSGNIKIAKGTLTDALCYEGYEGYDTNCNVTRTSDNAYSYESTRPLAAGEGVSVVASFPKGTVPIVTIKQPMSPVDQLRSSEFQIAFLVAIVLGIFGVLIHWARRGRDFVFMGKYILDPNAKTVLRPLTHRDTVVVEYTPPENLRPAEIGVIADERADTLDVTSSIIDLAIRGYLKIKEIPKKWTFGKVDYELTRTQKTTDGLESYEKELLSGLFKTGNTVKVSDLKTKFYQDLARVKEKLYADVIRKEFFPHNPSHIKGIYLTIFIILTAVVTALLILNGTRLYPSPIVTGLTLGLFPAGILGIALSRSMSRRTAKGAEMARRIKGYRLFLSQVEKHRQKFFEDKNLFNEIMPYAIVFGLTDKIAKAAKDMGVKPDTPSWYTGASAFHATTFARNISNFSSSVGTSIASSPSSSGFSGGGSSGGGFGGGGGGSW